MTYQQNPGISISTDALLYEVYVVVIHHVLLIHLHKIFTGLQMRIRKGRKKNKTEKKT